jgi:hypothetical protein
MIRMLVIGYCFGIRSERRLCEEAHLNISLASLGGHSLSTPVSAFALSATCARHSACFVGPQVRHDQEMYRAVVLLYGRDTGRRNEAAAQRIYRTTTSRGSTLLSSFAI